MRTNTMASLFQRRYNLLAASVFFAAVFWIFEAYRHYIDSHTITFIAEIFSPDSHELWMRSVIVFLFVIYGVLAQTLFGKFKDAEKATRQAYFELDQIFQTSADGMRVVDSDFNITRVNKTLLTMANQKRADDVVGKKCYEIFYGPTCHTKDCPLVQITEGKHRVEYETTKSSIDGLQVSCIVTATPFYNSENRLLGIVEDFKDISDRKKTELALRESQEEWEKTFNAINDIVSLQDTSMKIVKVNKTGCDTLGLPCENIIGKHCYELFQGSNEPCPECPLLATQETFKPYTKEITHEKLGKIFLVSAAPVLDDQGKLTHIAHVAKDITEKKKIEERLFLNEKLETIAGLAAGVAHEINTPLSAILQSQQMISMGLDPDKPKNKELAEECGVDLAKVQTYFEKKNLNFFMKGMRDSAITAGKIIKNLLEFSRPHKGEIRNANLSNLLDTTLELAKADYDLKMQYDIINVEIIKEYDPTLNEVPCVAMEFEQVILNLIKNAVHAMTDNKTENPCITVRTSKTELMARIEVEDNGPGIDEETKLHIFDPFFTTKEIGRGTGLGLSVSHALVVDRHRGNIWVESELGKGAKFIMELPLSQEG